MIELLGWEPTFSKSGTKPEAVKEKSDIIINVIRFPCGRSNKNMGKKQMLKDKNVAISMT